jgi:multidrug efflux pump subunit AcrB
VTISVAILISGFVSVSLTPMLAARWLRPGTHLRHGRAYMAIENVFEWSRRVYGRTLWATLRHKWVTLAVSFALLGAAVYMFRVIPKGFIPTVDTGQINATTEFAQGIGFDAMVAHQKQVADIIKADPNVFQFTSNVGSGPGGGRRHGAGADEHRPQAVPRADEDGGSGDRGPAAESRRRNGRAGVSLESAGDSHRRPAVAIGLPVHAAEHRFRRAL